MTKHPHPNQLSERAEIERTINRAKALRAEMFRTACAAMIGFVCALVRTTFSNVATFRSRYERWRVHILQSEDAASGPASAR